MAESTLTHSDILLPGESAHLARAMLSRSRPAALHGHDFHELLWVQNGVIRHHLPDSQVDLVEGDLVFVRPGDRHALQARSDAAMAVSVTLDPLLVTALALRLPRLAGRLFWQAGALPASAQRDARQLAAINQAALRLERGDRSALAVEAFLLPLLAALAEDEVELPSGAPDWLARACAAAGDPEVFRQGAAGLVRVAGRAHPHVSRSMRRFMDQSPSDYINERRMIYAARRLAGSADTLAEIAEDCGIPNLSHFHKLFRARFGETPQRWRRSHQTDVFRP